MPAGRVVRRHASAGTGDGPAPEAGGALCCGAARPPDAAAGDAAAAGARRRPGAATETAAAGECDRSAVAADADPEGLVAGLQRASWGERRSANCGGPG